MLEYGQSARPETGLAKSRVADMMVYSLAASGDLLGGGCRPKFKNITEPQRTAALQRVSHRSHSAGIFIGCRSCGSSMTGPRCDQPEVRTTMAAQCSDLDEYPLSRRRLWLRQQFLRSRRPDPLDPVATSKHRCRSQIRRRESGASSSKSEIRAPILVRTSG